MVKSAKGDCIFRRAWLGLRANYPLSKKPKNARMGKGKGSFTRWALRIKPGRALVEFQGFPHVALRRVIERSGYTFTTPPTLVHEQLPRVVWGGDGLYEWETHLDITRLWP